MTGQKMAVGARHRLSLRACVSTRKNERSKPRYLYSLVLLNQHIALVRPAYLRVFWLPGWIGIIGTTGTIVTLGTCVSLKRFERSEAIERLERLELAGVTPIDWTAKRRNLECRSSEFLSLILL